MTSQRRFVLGFVLVATVVVQTLVASGAFAESLAPAPEGTFTFAVIPDTQRYHGPGSGRDKSGESRNPAFLSRTTWIAEHLDEQRIVFVSHMGDIVDHNDEVQWPVARACINVLDGKIPYGVVAGNHDMERDSGNSSLFQKYFGAERFEGQPWYGGYYPGHPEHGPAVSGNNANSYSLFSAGGLDFVILHVECNAPDDVLAWVDGVLEAHRDRMAIIATHMYLGGIKRKSATEPQGRMQWKKVHGDRGNTPQQLWEKCFSRHANVFLILCGDQSASITHHQQSTGEHGNVVYEILQDYPRDADDSDWLRLYRFVPEEKKVEVRTYSPTQDKLCEGMKHVPERSDHQFELDISGAMAVHRAQMTN